jgi:uncharacterized protein YfiM (DUF2279 family)
MIISTAVLYLSLVVPPDPWWHRWVSEDKWKHFFASFVVTSISASGARLAGLDADASVATGAAVGLGAGVWKEWHDARQPEGKASFPDLVWDVAGVGTAAAALSQTR